MIDVHCHILPEVDDGAASLAASLAMARRAIADGVEAICATPHMYDGRYDVTQGAARAALERLRDALAAEGLELAVHLGAECRLGEDLLAAAAAGTAPTLGDGPYLLVELAPGLLPASTEPMLFQLRARALRPVLAHPERHGVFQGPGGIERLRRLVAQDVLVQVTAGALTGAWGPETEACARRIVGEGLCHLVASDAHGERSRPPVLSEARRVLEGLAGIEAARRMVLDRPAALLAGATTLAAAPLPGPARGRSRAGRSGGWLRRLWPG